MNLYDTSIVIKRNTVELPHIWTEFVRGEAKKEGRKYPAPAFEINKDTPDDVIKSQVDTFMQFLDPSNTLEILFADYKIICQQTAKTVEAEITENLKLTLDSDEGVKKFVELFTKYMTELTTRGLTKAELLAENMKLSEDVAVLTEDAMKYQDSDPAKAIGYFLKIKKCMDSIRRNNLTIASKARSRNKDEEPEATPVNA